MFKFSASRGIADTKTYYKDYHPETVAPKEVGSFLKRFSVSSYLYKEGVTTGGEKCQGHRAGGSVVGSGNVLLFDFDSKYEPIKLEMLTQRLKGVLCYIAPSKNWSPEVEKYHVVIGLDRDLPLNKDEFKSIYRATAQWLQLEGLYDTAQESWVQQLAPHYRDDCPELLLEGEPVNVDAVLSAYIPDETLAQSGGSTMAGFVPVDTEFTLSVTPDRVLSVDEMVEHIKEFGHARVHCIAGYTHGETKDSAFCSLSDEGDVLYHCVGNRCGHTLKLPVNPFSVDLAGDEVEVRKAKPLTVRERLEIDPVHSKALEPKAPVTDLENAINFILKDKAAEYLKIDGFIRQFNGKIWEISFNDNDSAMIREMVQDLMEAVATPVFVKLASNYSATSKSIKYFEENIKTRIPRRQGNYLNLENGILEITEGEVTLLPHDASYLFTSSLPYSYDAEATCPVWEELVNRIMCNDPDLVKALQESLGYMFVQSKNFEKMIGFVGEGANGKSTVMKVMKWLVGDSGYSTCSLKEVLKAGNEGDYRRAQMAGKLFNLTTELSPEDIVADAFKALISGEGITGRRIYGEPFAIEPAPKQVSAMNKTSHLIKEKTHGFERRFHLIPFYYTVPDNQRDPDLDSKLLAELSGILNWCLKGAQEVVRNNKLFVADAMIALFEKVKLDSNPVQQFLNDRIEVFDPIHIDYDTVDQIISGKVLYPIYCEYIKENGYKPLGRNTFLAEIRRLGVQPIHTTYSKPKRPNKSVKGYPVRIVADADVFTSVNVSDYDCWF